LILKKTTRKLKEERGGKGESKGAIVGVRGEEKRYFAKEKKRNSQTEIE